MMNANKGDALMDKKELALDYMKKGCNCAQSVLCAYAEELDISEEFLNRIGACFGGGMGGTEGTCGALVGAEMVLGLKKYQGSRMSKDANALFQNFKEKCGSTVCREIKGAGTGKVLCSCQDCVANAVEILETM